MCLWSVIVLVSFVLLGLVGGRVFGLVGGRVFGCVLLCLMWVGPFFLWAGDGVVPWVGSVVSCLEQVLTFLVVAVQAGGESWWIGFWFGLMVWLKLTHFGPFLVLFGGLCRPCLACALLMFWSSCYFSVF